uniref:BRCT domain-containing protein n=1 Tax=Denticeps clupeoides TaxID=299321 RepID=A0AAY4EMS4_9TELE
MLPLVRKRSRPGEAHGQGSHEVRFTKVTIYLVERRMGRSRRRILTNLARSKGFYVEDILSGTVTHIVAEGNPAMELWLWLRAQGLPLPARLEVLDISWFTESMQAGEPVPVETRHRIQVWLTDHNATEYSHEAKLHGATICETDNLTLSATAYVANAHP